ncbi:oxidoreductase [Chelativorans sp. Marseille-P2723]|uniref:oxidoreductase n=1 Tax=Chelativorans sp. Marseille-P2723 TaxID=2709133 RepID=UPI00156F75BF|nr:oxidoreductase [Chelativorans sp. Marseille-P2723]
MPTWFITGCSTGFGRELAKAVLKRGWNAAVTARDPAAITDIVADHPERALSAALDVTDKSQIIAAVNAAQRRFGRIDVLVNNAGYGYRSALEESDEEEIHRLFDTNVFGLIEVTRAVLPLMRRQRSGHIVNISSVAGRVANPGSSLYAASKFAVNGLSKGLAQEVRPLGIKVTIVEPSAFRTDFAGRSIRDTSRPMGDYAATAGKQRAMSAARQGKQAGDPARAADAIIEAVEQKEPPLHLLLGANAVERVRAELEERAAELAAWEDVSRGADFPEQTLNDSESG